MAVNKQKLLPGSTFSNVKTDTENIKKQTDPKLNIYKKVVKIDKLLKNSLLLQTKEQSKKRKELENQKRGKREKELETPKKFKGFQVLKNALPKIGFFDSIKRFILFTFAGWLFTNLFQFLPKLLEFVKILSPVLSWFEKGIGLLLEGIISFIDLGYKAYDSVRSFAKTIGGEKFAEKFDQFSGVLNTFLNLALIAAMSAGSLGGFGGGRGGPGKGTGARPTPGTGGRPRVTTSGGGGVGRPDIRNPLRERPTVTTSGGGRAGRPDLRNPLRQRPRVTTGTGGGVGKGLGKVAGKGLGKFAGKLPFVGPLIDFGIRRFIFKEPLGRAAAGAVGVAAGQALGSWLGGSLGGIVGSVVPVAGTLLGAGGGALIGNLAGGFIGDWIGTSLYDMIDSGEDSKPKKMSSGGKVSSTRIREKRKENKLKLKKDAPQNIQPGKDVGGEREIERIYPNPGRKLSDLFSGFSWSGLLFGGKGKDKIKRKDRKKFPNAIKTLLDVADSLGSSGDWIGSLMRASIQVALGQMPDVKSLAKTISGVLRNVSDPAIKGIKSITRELFGFVGGGEVASLTSSLLSAEDTLTLERNIEINLRNKFEDALGIVRKESKKRGVGREDMEEQEPKPGAEPPIPGKDAMIEENIQKGKGGGSSYGSPEMKALLDVLAFAEGTTENRNGAQGPAGYSTWAGYQIHGPRDLTTQTIQQVHDLQTSFIKSGKVNVTGSAVVGRYQFKDLRDHFAKQAGLKPNDLFSPANQDKMAIKEMERVGVTTEMLKKRGLTTDILDKLAPIWASIPYSPKGGKSYYGQAYKNPDKLIELYKKKLNIKVEEAKKRETETKPGTPGFNLLKPSTWFSEKDKKKEESEGSGGKLGGKGNFIQGNSGNSRGVHFHIGPGKQTEGTILQSKYNADARASATKVVDYFLKKGSKIYDGRRGVYYKSAKEVAAAQKAHTASGSQGGIDLQVDFETPHKFPLSTFGMKYRKNGFGVSADITGSNSFVAHGRYDEKGKVAPQESMKLYRGGGLISPSTPNVPMPDSFAPYNDPRQSSTLAVQPVIIEKMMPIPIDSPIAFPSGGSGVNNSVLPSLMQG